MAEDCITITFGDVAENHVRMEKIGTMAEKGFDEAEMRFAEAFFRERGCAIESVDLRTALPVELQCEVGYASILVVREGLRAFGVEADALRAELVGLTWDTKALMKGRVVNKHARHNLCFSEVGHEPDYENGKGRVVGYGDVALLDTVRRQLVDAVGESARDLKAEGNLYFNPKICGIGFHGDAERRKVIAVRLGASMPLHYLWHKRSVAVGQRVELMLNHGDVYIMSEKAAGTDWMKKVIPTLRHAAGAAKFLEIGKELGRGKTKSVQAKNTTKKKQGTKRRRSKQSKESEDKDSEL